MESLPASVELVEVGPRDGLQAIPRFIPTEDKVRLLDDLSGAGFGHIEATAFVSPKAVPQMRDSRTVAESLDHSRGVIYWAVVPNLKGLEAAIETGIRHVGVLTAASETYTKRNTNTSIAGSMERIGEVLAAARLSDVIVRGYVSCAVSCPYEGPMEARRVAELAAELLDMGCERVVIGDTTGEGTVPTTIEVLERVLDRVPVGRLGVHFHDTFGQALANVVEALRYGVASIDCSVAGFGGSPTAPEAGGNLASEDVLYLLDQFGIAAGVDVKMVADIGVRFSERFELPNASKAGTALGRRP